MDHWLESFAETAFRRAADTAHDLKTPLNVAILNLELLKMRLVKLVQTPDDKIAAYAASIETELRRMARIFDTFFLLSAPPKNDGEPRPVDGAARVLAEEGRTTTTTRGSGRFEITIQGLPQAKDFELTKIFKFYYSDPEGKPDLSLAAARLIAETYGGALSAGEEHDKVWLR